MPAYLTSFARKRLALWCWSSPTSTQPLVIAEYSDACDSLQTDSNAPGGFGTLSVRLRIKNPYLPRPELAMFSRIALVAGKDICWLGEIVDPLIGMDEGGDYIRLTALGIGNALRDDPFASSYTSQTAQQIAQAQLTLRTVTFLELTNLISTDASALFPDNPAATSTVAYDNRTFEEVLNDQCLLLGDYTWCVWDDPNQKDAAGYPLGRIEAHLRDTATTSYLATLKAQDISQFEGGPTAERAYNFVEVDSTSATGGLSMHFYTDPRLTGGTFAQGSAPFRYRKYVRDLTGTQTVNAAQAQAIANAYGALYQNPSNKWTFTLKRAHNATGVEIPLALVRADRNIFIPDFAVRGATLPKAPTAGVNQFYITSASYSETGSGAELALVCDNWVSTIDSRIARLQLAADNKARSGKTVGGMVAQGVGISGICSLGQSNASASGLVWGYVGFGATQLYQAPTSVSFSTISATNMSGVAATDLRAYGFSFNCAIGSAGAGNARFTYTTSGNCIRAIRRTRMDWHCDGCGKEFRGLAIGRVARVFVDETAPAHLRHRPGQVGLAIDCPECGRTECFNTALTGAEESERHQASYGNRAEQARLIRALMRHPRVGLPEVLP